MNNIEIHIDINIEELELNNGWSGPSFDEAEIELTELIG